MKEIMSCYKCKKYIVYEKFLRDLWKSHPPCVVCETRLILKVWNLIKGELS